MKHTLNVSDPSYTSKWRCKDCGQLYGYNPAECEVCGHTLFRPLPADGVTDTFDGGEETTELGADVSELVEETNRPPDLESADSERKEQAESERDSQVSINPEEERQADNGSEQSGFLSSLIPWL